MNLIILSFILDGTGSQQDEPNQVHPGVMCDGCESSICGPRYKCLVCPDYDLCKTCEGTGTHVEHDMMKITTPGGMPGFPGFPFGGPPPFGGPHGGGPHGGGPHGNQGVCYNFLCLFCFHTIEPKRKK